MNDPFSYWLEPTNLNPFETDPGGMDRASNAIAGEVMELQYKLLRIEEDASNKSLMLSKDGLDRQLQQKQNSFVRELSAYGDFWCSI